MRPSRQTQADVVQQQAQKQFGKPPNESGRGEDSVCTCSKFKYRHRILQKTTDRTGKLVNTSRLEILQRNRLQWTEEEQTNRLGPLQNRQKYSDQ